MGFELEIPVTFVTDTGENVATKMAYIDTPIYKIEGDKSHTAGSMKGTTDLGEVVLYKPTILEVVTKPFDEHADNGQQKLIETLEMVEYLRSKIAVMTGFYKNEITLGALADAMRVAVQPEYRNYRINAPTETARTYKPGEAYVHFTVGISHEMIPRAAEWIMSRSVPEYPGRQTHAEWKDVLDDLEKYIGDTFSELSSEQDPIGYGAYRQVLSYLYLAFTQVRAVDREEKEGGNIAKNFTPLLSRAGFYNIHGSYTPKTKEYLANHGKKLLNILWSKTELSSEKAKGYLQDIGNLAIKTPREYFGGMVVKPVERTTAPGGSAQGPPVEIRGLGRSVTEPQLRDLAGTLFTMSRGQFGLQDPQSPLKTDSVFVEAL
jgi:hypothetical protein